MGLLSDRVGRKQVAIGAALYLMVLSWPLFAIMSGANFATAIVCVTFFAIGVAGAVGAPSTIFVEMNPTRTRMATFAVGYNIGGALFGGTAVFVAQLLVTLTGDPRATAYYLIIAAVISLITLLTVRKYIRTGQPLDLFDGIPVPDESPLAGRSGNPLRAS
jgi:MHS family proline/betaine transporter-like MFS transporter